ncbi:RluA family pseudouridine synthase [bacterium]|nr:RluA family pseudouridine synthase [bacterium]
MSFGTITVQQGEPALRLDQILLSALQKQSPKLSRRKLKVWFSEKKVRRNGKALPSHFVLPEGEHEVEIEALESLLADVSGWSARAMKNPPSSEAILYEDESLLVLNKPSGLPSVPLTEKETETAVGMALNYFPALKNALGDSQEPGLLHRLDNSTSGALAFAKTPEDFKRLKQAWRSGEVKKTYRAIVDQKQAVLALGTIPKVITTPLAHDPKSKKKMIAVRTSNQDFRGRILRARTSIQRLTPLSKNLWDLEIQIETGVMHQIRCHLASLGMPILGDPIYKGGASERIWLHAWRLAVPTRDQTELIVEAQLPKDWPRA